MAKINFNERRNRVFEYIVTAYVELGIPVGSVVLCNRSNLGLSPATIRNIMRELEESGLITQPHTSAGRIPTDKGYRYYLDNIMELEEISDLEQDSICSACESADGEPQLLLENAMRLLAEISNEASIALLPKTRLISFGWHHLLIQPEFREDVSRPSRLLKAFEEKHELRDFVGGNADTKEVKVFIGRENACSDISDCSLVISGYDASGTTGGAIGLIGPTRMPYKRLVPMVDFIADQISCELEET